MKNTIKIPVDKFDGEYWSNRYINDDAAWDMGKVSPPLKIYFDQLTDKNISILIPGCGNAYEAAYLLQQGFTNITLIDISEVLANHIREKFAAAADSIRVIFGDFFDLTGQFDLIVEQTFFCALDPQLRDKYVSKMYDLLKPGGKLSGVMFNREFEGGPPFSGSEAEYRERFSEKFNIKTMGECYNSVAPRAGAEVFVIFEKYVQG